MAGIELRGVCKSFGSVEVIGGIDLVIEDGGFTVFVGPSGCGKSTLLRLMSGLDEISGGEILLGGRRCDHLMPAARGMAMVFQSYALYPHMTVEQNLRFGLENARLSKAQIAARVAGAAEILKIEPLLGRRPGQLSGGQSQRVAIGRAIVKEPEVFLFDEPLSNLDAELRIHMRSELVSLYRRLGTTMVYVTHDQTEAMTMATRIVVLRGGAVEQVGAPIELYARPRNAFVAGFLGTPKMNFLPARYEAGARPCARLASGAAVELPARMRVQPDDAPITLGIRPEHAVPAAEGVPVRVDASEVLGAETILLGEAEGGAPFTLTRRGIVRVEAGQIVPVHLPPDYLHAFDAEGLSLADDGEDWRAAYLSEMSPAAPPPIRAGGMS